MLLQKCGRCLANILASWGGCVRLFGLGRFRVRWGPRGPNSLNLSLVIFDCWNVFVLGVFSRFLFWKA